MKKYILLFLFISGIAFAQDANRPWFTSKQGATIDTLVTDIETNTTNITALSDTTDSLRQAINDITISSAMALDNNKIYVGGATNVPIQATIGGDMTGVRSGTTLQLSYAAGSITNADVNSGADISPTKIDAGADEISVNEFRGLNGFDLDLGTIQAQINAINTGSGYFNILGDEIEGDSRTQDDIVLGLGNDDDMAMYYDSGNNQSVFLSTPKLQMGTISATDWEFYTNTVKRITITSGGHIIPGTANVTNLGSATYPFNDTYFNTTTYEDGPTNGTIWGDSNVVQFPMFASASYIGSYRIGMASIGGSYRTYMNTGAAVEQFMLESDTEDAIDLKVKYTVKEPSTSAGGTITHVYMDSTYNRYYINPSTSTTVYFYNMKDYVIECRVVLEAGETIAWSNLSGYTIKWVDNPTDYSFTQPGAGDFKYVFEVWTNTTEIIAYKAW